MIVHIRLFAAARQSAGHDVLELEMPESATIGELRRALARHCPALKPWAPHLLFTLDRQYAADHDVVRPAAEITCFPPVSGG